MSRRAPATLPLVAGSLSSRARLVSGLASLAALVAACAPPPPVPVSVAVRVFSDDGRPVPRAGLFSGSTLVAVTDDQGLAPIEVSGVEGETFQVVVKCPPGFKSPNDPLLVRRLGINAAAAPEYRVSCQSTRHTMVVAVRADDGPDLPVLYLGKEIARTDANGAANVMFEMDVGDRVELKLSTAGVEKIHPQNPVAVFEMPDHEDVQVFPVKFTRDKKRIIRAAPRTGPRAF